MLALPIGQLGGSALTDRRIEVPQQPGNGIPVTYVPARNTVFLACALAWTEVLGARDIFIGVNAIDYSGYPDCRPEFIAAFETRGQPGDEVGRAGRGHPHSCPTDRDDESTHHPPAAWRSAWTYSITVSCYQADDRRARLRRAAIPAACGERDSSRRGLRTRPATDERGGSLLYHSRRLRGAVSSVVEHLAFNQLVDGSIPSRPTNHPASTHNSG